MLKNTYLAFPLPLNLPVQLAGFSTDRKKIEMPLLDQIKDKLKSSIKSKDENAKNALRIFLGRIQTTGKEDDDSIITFAKTIIKQNEDSIAARLNFAGQEKEITNLQEEIEIIKSFLPQNLSVEKITNLLTENIEKLKNAPNAGAATGVAMKILKSYGSVDGNCVKEIVSKLIQAQNN